MSDGLPAPNDEPENKDQNNQAANAASDHGSAIIIDAAS
jgi:hypothetical protein